MVIVIVALVADWLIGQIVANIPGITLPFQYTVLLAPLVIVWYIIGELGSLAEHAVTFGAPVPESGDKLTGSEEGDGQGDK